MKDKINSYFAVLLITIAGAAATLLIMHIANSRTLVTIYGDQAVIYTYDESPQS